MDKHLTKLLIGSVGILVLYYFEGIGETVEWLKIALIGGLLSIFFFSPIYDLFFGKFTKEDLFLLSVGFLYSVFYLVITESTLYELGIEFTKSLVMIAVISVFLEIIKEKVEEVV